MTEVEAATDTKVLCAARRAELEQSAGASLGGAAVSDERHDDLDF